MRLRAGIKPRHPRTPAKGPDVDSRMTDPSRIHLTCMGKETKAIEISVWSVGLFNLLKRLGHMHFHLQCHTRPFYTSTVI